MARRMNGKGAETQRKKEGISRISACGYKSISSQMGIEIKPLTILAGANSSGKSSIMQPLLLLKQTLEASYDPGPLLLDGPNVRFSSAEQLFSRIDKGGCVNSFWVGIEVEPDRILTTYFRKHQKKGITLQQTTYTSKDVKTSFRLGMTPRQISASLPPHLKELSKVIKRGRWLILRNRCFLELELRAKDSRRTTTFGGISPSAGIETYIRELIHLPGLRGNPERTYPVTAVGPTFPGTFEKYVASVISQWQAEQNREKLGKLARHLERLGLTWKVAAKPINDTQVELQVGRLPHATRGGARDLVNVADVGFGMSQTLPVLVALLAAKPGQLVYLEQPEIHLHPRAQSLMAEILAEAAISGVRVVAETHSSLLLLGVQTIVAEASRKLDPDMVKLHWFTRRPDGSTKITSAELDESGAFGDWPEDFGEVFLEAESRYLNVSDISTKN